MEEKEKLQFERVLVFLGLFLVISLLVWYALSRTGEIRLIEQERMVQQQILELQSFQTSLSMMQEWGNPPHTPQRSAVFRGYRVQALAILSSFQKSGVRLLTPRDQVLLNALEGLTVYSAIQAKDITASHPFIPLALRTRMVSLSLQLLRHEEHSLMTIYKDLVTMTQRRMRIFEAISGVVVFVIVFFVLFQRQSGKVVRILEFELTLIERLIITSNVIEDWKDQVKQILRSVGSILPMDFFFSVFVTKESSYEANVFWSGTPSPGMRKDVELLIHKKVEPLGEKTDGTPLAIDHNPINGGRDMEDFNLDSVELSTKNLFLDTPKIGGIVGAGIRIQGKRDRVSHLVVESLLTSILNVLGSVKAIHMYTKEMEYYAVRDPLTTLFNQRVFWEFLDYEIARNARYDTPGSIMILDLDDFKGVNDTFGHATGDAFLQHVAEVIRKTCRNEDIPCRYGGDEFVVIFPDADTEQAYSIAQRVRQELFEKPFLRNGHSVHSSTSIGIASFPAHGRTAHDIFHVADHMLYRAKKAGKNTVLSPTYDDIREAFLVSTHKKAFILDAVNNRRVVPFFQPIRDLKTGGILGCEVLSRLPNETGDGYLSAGDFIEIVEDTGLIAQLDYTIMEKAFEEKVRHEFQGLLFVNMSPKVLFIPEFFSRVQEMVLRTGVPPNHIVFEITERDAVRNLRLMEMFIQNLRGDGFRFAVDDFGSGYSSLHYLRTFPIDFVKIDGPFIVGMGEGNSVDAAIVRSIVTLGEDMGVQVIGESVESEVIRETALAKNVAFGQGFHLGKPEPRLPLYEGPSPFQNAGTP